MKCGWKSRRCCRWGCPIRPMADADIRVASGNFVTARPLGVRGGVDLLHTGEVRKIDAVAIRRRLDDNDIVLLSPLGYSPTGEIFNLSLEDVATNAAMALGADKLIFLMETEGVHNARGGLLRELTVPEAEKIVAGKRALPEDEGFYLPCAITASKQGVSRVHLISRHVDGALLPELFTHAGIGTMLTPARLETLRQATIDDVGGILQLIDPLEEDGMLVRRSRELLEMEIERFIVLEHDGILDRLRRALPVCRRTRRRTGLPGGARRIIAAVPVATRCWKLPRKRHAR